MDADRVRVLLDTILDPCSVAAGHPVGISEMGLVRGVEVEGDGRCRVRVRIAPTEPGCLMAVAFATSARKLLESQPEIDVCEVALDHEAQWMPEDQSVGYRERLAQARQPRSQPVVVRSRREGRAATLGTTTEM